MFYAALCVINDNNTNNISLDLPNLVNNNNSNNVTITSKAP